MKEKKKFGFDKDDRSSFAYWFAHWASYQMTALNLHSWKFKYLFHDFEKPWMKLFCSYKTVQKFHRTHNKHHLNYKNPKKIDWDALIIDWECSRFTKLAAPLTAKQTYENYINRTDKYSPEIIQLMKENIPPILEKLSLYE